MKLESLHIKNFRCLSSCDLEPASGLNCIVGDNMAGKTSLLEAIHILGRGGSFRQSSLTSTLQKGHAEATLRTRFCSESGFCHRIGCSIFRSGHRFKLDDQTSTRRFDLLHALPLQHIDPNVHRLIEQGPKYRRHFLDWGVFHVEQAFFPAWRRYRRALKQRNRALRAHQPAHQIGAWDGEMVKQGEIIDACRRRYIEYIEARLPEMVDRFICEGELTFSYSPGWRGSDGLGAALGQGLTQDMRAGFTQQGPHRADLRVAIGAANARDWASRGQQKILTTAMLLTQAAILLEKRGVRPILLFDDMAAELGAFFRNVLAEEIERLQLQCFLTFLDKAQIPAPMRAAQMFHVERGCVESS